MAVDYYHGLIVTILIINCASGLDRPAEPQLYNSGKKTETKNMTNNSSKDIFKFPP